MLKPFITDMNWLLTAGKELEDTMKVFNPALIVFVDEDVVVQETGLIRSTLRP
jgi:hypothetical protein